MSALTSHLDRLEAWLRRNPQTPTWTGLRIVEAGRIKYGPVDTIPKAALQTVADYEPRFESLIEAGYAWINLSALGVYDDELLVCVELPRDPVGVPAGRTSVNLSGPPLDPKTGAHFWNTKVRMVVVE